MRFVLIACCGGLLLTGCVDPTGAFDDFVTRQRASLDDLPDAGAPPQEDAGAPVLPHPDELSGEFLLVTSTTLSRRKPTVYRLESEASMDGDGLKLRLRDQPLSAADRMTPVGDFSAWREARVDKDGMFEFLEVSIVTPGAANPVNGVETEALLDYRAQLRSARTPESPDATLDFFCGDVSGELLRPISRSLDGSTFVALRLPDSGEWPKIVINCNLDEADPL
jgi:hypothetical protein